MPIPYPLPLYCALLVCVPVAIVFTVTAPRPVTTIAVTEPVVLVVQKPQNTPKPHQVITIPPPAPSTPDDELLRLASRVDPNPPFGRPKKIAFMFLTTTALPFAPLWEIFFNQNSMYKNLYNIYIHTDPVRKSDPRFSGVFENRVILSSKPAFRHTPTLVSAARRLLAHALLDDPCNYMFALLSPSCIPLHSFNFTYTTLVSSSKSFIEVLKDEPGWYDRWAARGPHAMLPEVRPQDFRIGSQFWVLTRAHARTVARDVTLWGKFNRPCVRRDTCYPEEHYFPTLLHMRDPQGSVAATLTHVDWSVSAGGHPRTYRQSEVGPGLIHRLRNARPRYGDDGGETDDSDSTATPRNDPFLFARKFSPAAIGPLLSIAKNVIFNDSAIM